MLAFASAPVSQLAMSVSGPASVPPPIPPSRLEKSAPVKICSRITAIAPRPPTPPAITPPPGPRRFAPLPLTSALLLNVMPSPYRVAPATPRGRPGCRPGCHRVATAIAIGIPALVAAP